MKTEEKTGLQAALENFLNSQDFRGGIITCTLAQRQKTSYVLELTYTGQYRVLWQGQVGNKNSLPGQVFLDLPTLEDKDLTLWRGSEESYFKSDFATKETELANQLRGQLNHYFSQ